MLALTLKQAKKEAYYSEGPSQAGSVNRNRLESFESEIYRPVSLEHWTQTGNNPVV